MRPNHIFPNQIISMIRWLTYQIHILHNAVSNVISINLIGTIYTEILDFVELRSELVIGSGSQFGTTYIFGAG